MDGVWGGEVVRVGVADLVGGGLPVGRVPAQVLSGAVREAHRELILGEVAAAGAAGMPDADVVAGLGAMGQAQEVLARVRLRLVCQVAQRGLHVGSGFSLVDWVQTQSPGMATAQVRDLARLATASTEEVHAPLVGAVLDGAMSVARAARIHRATQRIQSSLSAEQHRDAIEMLTEVGTQEVFDDRELDRVITEVVRKCLPERDHEDRARAQRGLRDLHESRSADGSLRRMVLTFGDDADYEAVRAIITSPLSAPATLQEQQATGQAETRTPGQRRYDAFMMVLTRGVAGSTGQPLTPKATLVVTMDLDTLRRQLHESRGDGPRGDGPEGDGPRGAGAPGDGAPGGGLPGGGLPGGGGPGGGLPGDGAPGAGASLEGNLLPASSIRRIACEAQIIPMVLDGPSEIVNQGRARRLVTPGQRIRLAVRDRGCTIPGCSVPATWCDAHHVIHWSRGGRSDLTNYALLCPRHHTYVHDHDLAATVTGLGVRWHLE